MTTPAPPPLSRTEEKAVQAIIQRAAHLSIEARRQLWVLFARQERAYTNRMIARQRSGAHDSFRQE